MEEDSVMARFYYLLILFFSTQCFALDKSELLAAIDQADATKIIAFFNKIDSIDREEASTLITEVYRHCISQFGSEILCSKEYLDQLNQSKDLYHSILSMHGVSLKNSLFKNKYGYTNKYLLCNETTNDDETESEIPGSMIIGGVEILSGALLWILPFPGAKQIAMLIISDGIRRTFNGLEEVEKENKESS